MSTRMTILEEFTAEDGTQFQLTYTPGSATPWTLIVNGAPEESYDDYGDAMRA